MIYRVTVSMPGQEDTTYFCSKLLELARSWRLEGVLGPGGQEFRRVEITPGTTTTITVVEVESPIKGVSK